VRVSSAVAGAVAAVALIGGGVALVTLRHEPPTVAAIVDPTLTTTRVTRTDLSDDRLLPGSLGFGTARTVKGTGPGIVTRLPATGAKVRRGTALYKVDDQPVVVFYGDTPLFRPLGTPGLTGSDVRQLRDNLAALGFRRSSARPDTLDEELLAALKLWQQQLGITKPGTLLPGQVAVLSGPGRVSEVTAQPGDPAAGPLLSVSATTRVVTVPMSPTDVSGIRKGAAVRLTLPDGREVGGTVKRISRVVQGGGADPAGGTAPPKISVTVTPVKAKDVAGIDAATVQVRFTTTTRKDVLTVPVGALVALSEGGYALQHPGGSLIPVTTGLFAGGLVEVSGAGVTEDDTVVTTP
jgi:peptidoglycan hydrolase-like protein with peptidoglycan-binding domain